MDNTPQIKKIRKEQDITPHINRLKLPEEVRIEAVNIKRKMQVSGKRAGNLNKLIFFCVYCACMELDVVFTPNELARICSIDDDRKEINKVFKMFPSAVTGYSPPDDNKSPLDYVKSYFRLSKLHESELENVIELSKTILEKSKNLESSIYSKATIEDEFPQNVAISLIIYYLNINGLQLNYNSNEVDGISWSTVSGIVKRITIIDNS